MVSFNCDCCGDVITKGKIKTHANRCRINALSCLDCGKDFRFPSAELDAHTSCVSEAEKYGHAKGKGGKKSQKRARPDAEEEKKKKEPSPPSAAQVAEAKEAYKIAKTEKKLRKKAYQTLKDQSKGKI